MILVTFAWIICSISFVRGRQVFVKTLTCMSKYESANRIANICVYLCAFSMLDGMFSPRNSSLIALLIFNVPPMFLVHQCIYLVSLLLHFLNWMSMPKIYLNPQMYLNSRMAQNKAWWNIFFISEYSEILCSTGRDFETIVAVFFLKYLQKTEPVQYFINDFLFKILSDHYRHCLVINFKIFLKEMAFR